MKIEPYIVFDQLAVPLRCVPALENVLRLTYDYKDGEYHYHIASGNINMTYLSADKVAAMLAEDKLK